MLQIFKDERGKVSSTRVILLTTLTLFLLTGVVDVFSDIQVNESICQIMKTVLGTGLASTGLRASVMNYKEK